MKEKTLDAQYYDTGNNWFWKNSTTILLDTLAHKFLVQLTHKNVVLLWAKVSGRIVVEIF